MKPRRVILTIEAETDLPMAELKHVSMVRIFQRNGTPCHLYRSDDPDCSPRIVQVQVNAIKPEPTGKRKARMDRKAAFAERSAYRARLAKFAKEDARLAAADRLKADIDKAWQAHQRKAKRAKGAK